MTKIKYEQITAFYHRHSALIPILIFSNKILTLLGFFLYPCLLGYLLFTNPTIIPPYILIPGLSFIILSIFRKIMNRPRPYEALDITPLYEKKKCGQSFPSRHVFSFFLISTLWIPFFPYMSAFLLFLGLILSYLRVVLGVHYPSDVIAGMMIGILCARITFFGALFW